MDKVDDRDERLNDLCDRLGLFPPWKQWRNVIAPITAKRGDISHLERRPPSHLHEVQRDDLFQFFGAAKSFITQPYPKTHRGTA